MFLIFWESVHVDARLDWNYTRIKEKEKQVEKMRTNSDERGGEGRFWWVRILWHQSEVFIPNWPFITWIPIWPTRKKGAKCILFHLTHVESNVKRGDAWEIAICIDNENIELFMVKRKRWEKGSRIEPILVHTLKICFQRNLGGNSLKSFWWSYIVLVYWRICIWIGLLMRLCPFLSGTLERVDDDLQKKALVPSLVVIEGIE